MNVDGRNIDPVLAKLTGEGAGIASKHPDAAATLGAVTLAEVDRSDVRREEAGAGTTYHEQPVLKEPVWKGAIPAYFFVGGAAGACAMLAAAAQIAGGRTLAPLVRPARWVAATGCVVSAALLIADLGRPARFLNMLRVFRPTSPMNVGTWILSGAGATMAASAALPIVGLRKVANVAGVVAAPFGLGLASYTAVLLANSAVPSWQHGRRSLPVLFVASAAASGAAVLDLVPGLGRARSAVFAFGAVGRIAELAGGVAYERELRARGEVVARVLREGRSGILWRASKILTTASLGLSLASRFAPAHVRRSARVASGLFGMAGALALRFAVVDGGKASARDPRATFEPQRRDREARLRAGIDRTHAKRQPAPRIEPVARPGAAIRSAL